MRLTNRLEALEAALAKKHGESSYRLVIRADEETEEDALKRVGLGEWSGPTIFLSKSDLLL